MQRLSGVLVFVLGCSQASGDCEVDGDCATGEACRADHVCVAKTPTTGLDGGADSSVACAPNHDGVIERDEVVILVPASVNFRSSGETQVDLAGTKDLDGTRHWDLSGMFTGDHDTPMETAPLAGTWFASQFSGGQFITPLSGAGATDLLGVYTALANKVQILGAASKEAGPTQTKLTYDPPVDTFAFPLHMGQHWETHSSVTGTASGLPVLFSDVWKADIDAKGDVITPYGAFPVLRLRLQLARTIGLVTTTTTTYGFVAECFGTVATVSSRSNETALEFTTAAEVRRLAP
ncbi:MAG TPA: hypothetical protein VIV40_42410 [Kofleriaceae bacterium]